jgi:primosomal protein N' (replication factor Y)
MQTTPHNRLYASVILPVKYGGEISYILPKIFQAEVGSRVKVDLAGKIYSGVISKILPQGDVPTFTPDGKEIQYKSILALEELPKVLPSEIKLWERVAQYYMCSIGEVFKAAYPQLQVKQESVKPRKTVEHFLQEVGKDSISQSSTYSNGMSNEGEVQKTAEESAKGAAPVPQLSGIQQEAFNKIKGSHTAAPGKPVLLRGVTGSGKTEIYITLALEMLQQGKNILYMVPEIAISKQLQSRLKKVFGERLLTFHSKQTAAEKARIHRILQHNAGCTGTSEGTSEATTTAQPATTAQQTTAINSATIILGTRSSLFLPFSNLGLVIVDEEHDSSYKQTEPAPRYQAKDTAIMLAQLHGANVLIGSATPSYESEYNCISGKFTLVELTEKYYGAITPQVEIIDTIYARKTRQMIGSFSQKLINEIRRTVEEGYQVLIFRNRRSYSPVVECQECGAIPKCPHCNVHLSYHKYNHTLRCHYCEYIAHFTGVCNNCGTATFNYKGAGTEKLEEELASLFPNVAIARYDADIAKSKKTEEQTIKDFAEGKTSILVGTQMISKGFDFERLKLVAVLQAETILGIQDFRADEKATQLFSQLMGRTGRRGVQGKLIIQASQKDHPVLAKLHTHNLPDKNTLPPLTAQLLRERQEFQFAPFVRMVKVIVKHKDAGKLDELCREIQVKLSGRKNLEYKELAGPFTPAIDKVRGEFIKCFYIKFARNSHLAENKFALQKCIKEIKGNQAIVLDVDPL